MQRFGSSHTRVHFSGWGSEYSEVTPCHTRASSSPLLPLHHSMRPFAIALAVAASSHLTPLPQVMKNSDLAQRTRPRVQGTPVGLICAEVSFESFFSVVFWF